MGLTTGCCNGDKVDAASQSPEIKNTRDAEDTQESTGKMLLEDDESSWSGREGTRKVCSEGSGVNEWVEMEGPLETEVV